MNVFDRILQISEADRIKRPTQNSRDKDSIVSDYAAHFNMSRLQKTALGEMKFQERLAKKEAKRKAAQP